MSEPKYTMSFINGNPGFVIKTDTTEELDDAIREALPIFKKFKRAVDTYREKQEAAATPPPGQKDNSPICGIHNVQMTWRPAGVSKAGKPYQGFWSCPTRNVDGSYCKFKPESK